MDALLILAARTLHHAWNRGATAWHSARLIDGMTVADRLRI